MTSDADDELTGSLPVIHATTIDERLVRDLIAEQFPGWAELPLRFVKNGGKDHRMFRLGDALSVRLPSAPDYVPQVEKEQTWLPRLAPQLPLSIPVVEGAGRPSPLFPAPWSVFGWIDGERATTTGIRDDARFAAELAQFLVALRAADTTAAPAPGLHSAFRGGPLDHWDDEMRDLLHRVHGRERDLAAGLWRDALAASFDGPPVWVHGDVAIANLLTRDDRLSAVLDFGCAAAGDPSCDTVIFWTTFTGAARTTFRAEMHLDDAAWARGRGWALWKGLIMSNHTPPGQAEFARYVLEQLFAEV